MGVISASNPTYANEGKKYIQRINRRIESIAKLYGTSSYVYQDLVEGLKYMFGPDQIEHKKGGVTRIYLANTKINQAQIFQDNATMKWFELRAQATVRGKNKYWDERAENIIAAYAKWMGIDKEELMKQSKKDRTNAIRDFMSKISAVDKEVEHLLEEYYEIFPEDKGHKWHGLGYTKSHSSVEQKLQFLDRLQNEIAYWKARREESGALGQQAILQELQSRSNMAGVRFGAYGNIYGGRD